MKRIKRATRKQRSGRAPAGARNLSVFREAPLTSICPEGWLRHYLEKQARGLTGHLDVTGYPFNTKGWAGPAIPMRHGEVWWPYEQVAYWVDALARCGRLIGDHALIEKAKRQMDYVLSHADRDGYLGPKHIKSFTIYLGRWSHLVFFRALMAYHSATQDPRIVRALTRHYLSDTSDHHNSRDICNIEVMLWLYGKTGDKRILHHAIFAYEKFNRMLPDNDASVASMLSPRRATEHGVTYNETAKLGAILYMYTGRKRFLNATVNAYKKIDRDHILIDGVCSSSEMMAGNSPLDAHETCDIADYTWSVGYLLMATGKAEYADKIERACFNAAPGAVKSDFKALQYFSSPTQVIADSNSCHTEALRGSQWMSFRPMPGTECCAAQVSRIMPNYAARMWMMDRRGGIVAALYGPSRFTARLGAPRREVTIVQETRYPFSEHIDFLIRTDAPIAFPFTIRIPGWCDNARLTINGAPVKKTLTPSSFVTLNRMFRHNDRVSLTLPMKLRFVRWKGGGVAIERGPLVFSLKIDEDWRIDKNDPRSTNEFPASNLYPASPWNYALCVHEKTLERDVEVVLRPLTSDPWCLESAPIELKVPARRVKGWSLKKTKTVVALLWSTERGGFYRERLVGKFALTPPLPESYGLAQRLAKRTETITLVPYGCTHLRVTLFPNVPRVANCNRCRARRRHRSP